MSNRLIERINNCAEFLGEYEEMFEAFVSFCEVVLSPAIDTACITFDPEEGLAMSMVFNPDFVDKLDDYTLSFIIAHEICHVYFRHGIRGFKIKDARPDKLNVAMDIVVNHYLVDHLNFDRNKLQDWETLCWIDTALNVSMVPKYSFEHYYNLPDSAYTPGYKPIDVHKFPTTDEIPQSIRDIFANAPQMGIGDQGGTLDQWINVNKKSKKKFETIIKNRIGQICSKKPKKEDSWAKVDRRLCFVSDDLPVLDRVRDFNKPEKFKLLFFVDVSGSCYGYLKRFLEFAASIPEETFETDFFIFDTCIASVDLQTKDANVHMTIGNGGTSFLPLTKYVDSMEKAPDLVFVLTDGYASRVKVSNPNIWNWFITKGGSISAIRGQGKNYKMSSFE